MNFYAPLFLCSALLKLFVTMEVIRWAPFWEEYQCVFDEEKGLPGGALGDKAASDLRQRVIEHVR
jgi:26S proteasome regulatory subunit N5